MAVDINVAIRGIGHGKEQKNGAGYLTFCPVHGNKKTPALAVTIEAGYL